MFLFARSLDDGYSLAKWPVPLQLKHRLLLLLANIFNGKSVGDLFVLCPCSLSFPPVGASSPFSLSVGASSLPPSQWGNLLFPSSQLEKSSLLVLCFDIFFGRILSSFVLVCWSAKRVRSSRWGEEKQPHNRETNPLTWKTSNTFCYRIPTGVAWPEENTNGKMTPYTKPATAQRNF